MAMEEPEDEQVMIKFLEFSGCKEYEMAQFEYRVFHNDCPKMVLQKYGFERLSEPIYV